MTPKMKEFQFQAETKQLLDLMIHSLYTNKEIFLRELISNASDALDRLRFEALTNPALLDGDDRYEIRLDADREQRTLSISDTGIGMSQDEVIAHIGTIAKSGTRELREKIKSGQSEQMLAEFIGQFGVGFYASFMVADKVTLVTRRAGETAATLWESTGDGTYQLAEAERPSRGTTITLHLKPVDPDGGMEDFTDQWVLSRIVKRYSDFVSYPINSKFEREETERDPSGNLVPNAQPTFVIEDKTLNSMKPIWSRSQSEITESEYADFYRHISHDWSEPFKTIVLKAEGHFEYQALLFIPSKAPHDLFYHGSESGLRLYARRVMIMERCEELLPRYLRFIRGVVDSADLPLNISRQMLQQDRHITQIRKWLTKKVLDLLQDMKEKESDRYLQFWEQFGRALKEGVSSDYDNKDRILSLLLFQSSNDPEQLTTLKGYLERMKEGQSEIYYLTGESRSVVENSPHLESVRENGYEVLYLVEPVDELLMQSLMDFEGKRFKSIGKGTINLGDAEEREKKQKDLQQKEEENSGLLGVLQKALDESVKQVRLSTRLVSSPACLVGTEMDYSPQLERLLMKGKGGGPKQRRILELNPTHQIFTKLQERFQRNNEDPAIAASAELLLGYALLAEGSELSDPIKFNRLLTEMMLQTL
ncbi:MAG TPA: molecular chaperone HtpG [Blastocatellia bacterium]|nr:molecular chaperone HtpG [Blastocatellia bacterium]